MSLQFLPPNTTSVLQPLDLGIIQNMKCHYRTQPLTREDYTNVDCDVQSMETFEDGWENELLQDFVAEKTQTATPASYDSDVENEDTIEEPQQQLPIISYAEAMKFTTELRLFAVEKGLDSILSNIMSVESGLQESFLKHNGAMHQSSLDRFFQ